jgi:hypothetical protein
MGAAGRVELRAHRGAQPLLLGLQRLGPVHPQSWRQHVSSVTVVRLAVIAMLGCDGTTGPGASDPDAGASPSTDAGAVGDGDVTIDAGAAPLTDAGTEPGEPVRPTEENTGPRHPLTDITPAEFFAKRTCDRQRIVGNVDIDQSAMRGQTFTFTDCEITGRIYVYLQGGGAQLPLEDMPVLVLDYVHVGGGIQLVNGARMTIDHTYMRGSQWTLTDTWTPFVSGPAPISVSNSVFYREQGTPPDHTEALHAAHYGSGYRFTNVAFIQQGPNNGTATATINFHGSDSVFDGCWFLWEDGVAAYWTVYIDGPNNVVENSWFDSGAGYVYPDSETMATYRNNRNLETGELLELP